jgi:hypothetical protein
MCQCDDPAADRSRYAWNRGVWRAELSHNNKAESLSDRGAAGTVKKMQKKRISSLTLKGSDDYIPLTNEGGAAAGGNLLRSHGIHREPL